MKDLFSQSSSALARTCSTGVWFLIALSTPLRAQAENDGGVTFSLTVTRGVDQGQCFGSLFEVESRDGSLVIGAGFQNLFNTRLRADRHEIQFFVRSKDVVPAIQVEALPRPNDLCGTYLYGRDGTIRSIYGGLKAWNPAEQSWRSEPEVGGTHEVMRVGDGLLEFGDGTVRYKGQTILPPAPVGKYQHFFYANGHLCFYQIESGGRGYRPYQNDADGFTKLIAAPWTPGKLEAGLARAVVLTLPVVGENTFAWGQHGNQVFTGSNVGGFYILEENRWRVLLKPREKVSYQLYSSMTFYDQILMGQYPTGRLFAYDGREIVDRPGWPPVAPGASGSSREAQSTTIYGGVILTGVWPWGELWLYHPDTKQWKLLRRMFDHPPVTKDVGHPYEKENRNNPVSNLWGQRVTSLVTCGDSVFIATSAKSPCEWNPGLNPFLAPDKWKSYGSVYRLTMPGHLGASAAWTEGPTRLELSLRGMEMRIVQDGKILAKASVTGQLGERLRNLPELQAVCWGEGIYGKFNGPKIEGEVTR